jgi:DnaJ-like protein/uncharacterized protein DUF4388
MELTRGEVGDRPWGRTLGTLWSHRLTGQLTVTADEWRYSIAFDGGNIIGATSPVTIDDPVHIAFRAGLITSQHVDEIARLHGERPDSDDVELLARVARLPSEVALKIRRRAVAHAAARTFSLEHGTFLVEDRITIPIVAGGDFDTRAIVYFGARNNMSAERLNKQLAALGGWFVLAPGARSELAQYGFPNLAQGALDMLATGARLGDIDAWCPELDSHASRAMVYALVSFDVCAGRVLTDATRLPEVPRSIVRTTGVRAPTPPWLPALPQAAAVAGAPHAIPPARGSGPLIAAARVPSDPYIGRRALQAVLEERVGRGADHFELLGVPYDATATAIRTAYLNLVRQLRPDLELGNVVARSVFAQVAKAFGVIGDADRRAAYLARIRSGAPSSSRPLHRIDPADEALQRSEVALARGRYPLAIEELRRAITLDPDEAKYHALLAWAEFCNAPNKAAMASDTRAALTAAMALPGDTLVARYYLGRVERMLDHEDEALQHFRAVLERDPSHREAASEVRELTRRR